MFSTSLGRSMPVFPASPSFSAHSWMLVDAQQVAGGVEVHVARLLDGVAQVHPAVPAGQVALEEAAVERGAARAEDLGLGRRSRPLRAPRRDDDLEGRTRRVAALDGAVLQRPQLVGVERLPGGAVDAGGEGVRVVGRQAHQREHVAGASVRAPPPSPSSRSGGRPPRRRRCIGGVESHLDAAALDRRHLCRACRISRPTLLTTTRRAPSSPISTRL